MKFKVCKDLEYVQGYVRYGHGEVIVDAESEEEALKLAEKSFKDGDYDVKVDSFEMEDCGDFYGKAYIEENK